MIKDWFLPPKGIKAPRLKKHKRRDVFVTLKFKATEFDAIMQAYETWSKERDGMKFSTRTAFLRTCALEYIKEKYNAVCQK